MTLLMTKHQHYVPQFYLKNFSSNKKSIVLYRIKGKRPPVKNAAIKNICSEDYFYDRDNSIETSLSQKEDDWSAVLKEIIEQKQINQLTDKISLREFVSYQYMRTRGLLNHVSSMVQKLLLYIFFQDKVLQYLANDEKTQKEVVIEEIQKFAKEYAKDSITPAWLLTMTDGMSKGISDLRITILDNQTSKHFVTSDTPVIMMNPFSAYQVGFGVVGIVMIVPVSPKIAVMIYDDKVYNLNSDLYPLTNEDDVININKYTFLNAEEILLAADEADINSLIADQNLLTEKTDNDYRRLSEMLKNSIIHTKSRAVWKSYPLSFLKLPECFNDTLEMCREAFPRKYDIKNRVYILMRIYLIPNNIEERIAPRAEELVAAGEISEEAAKAINRASLEKGWKVLLDFMDTYWNISDNDKILSRFAALHLKKFTKVHFIEAQSKSN